MNDDIFSAKAKAKLAEEAAAERKVAEEKARSEEERKKHQKKQDLESRIRQIETQIHSAEFKTSGLKREIDLISREEHGKNSSSTTSVRTKIEIGHAEAELLKLKGEIHKLEGEKTRAKNQIATAEREISGKAKEEEDKTKNKDEAVKTEVANLKKEISQETLKQVEEKRKVDKLKHDLDTETAKLAELTEELKNDHSRYDELERVGKQSGSSRKASSNVATDASLQTKKHLLSGIEERERELEQKKQLLERNIAMFKVEADREARNESAKRASSDVMDSRMKSRSRDLEMSEHEVDRLKRELIDLKNEIARTH